MYYNLLCKQSMGLKTHIAKITILLILTINGCDYENPLDNKGNIQGKLLNINSGFPLYNYCVASNSAPIAIPNVFGEFYFENVSTPFDLNAFYRFSLNDITIFKNLRNRYPIILCDGHKNGRLFKVIVKIKDHNWSKIILPKFISETMFNDGFVTQDKLGSDLLISYEIITPFKETTINGKFIILECDNYYWNQTITSIDNYAEKSCTLRWNSKDTLVFESEDFNFNPVESNVVVKIDNYPNIYDSYTDIYIDFIDYYYESKLKLNTFNTWQNSTYDFMVPESLPINFKIRAENRSSIQDSMYISLSKWIYLNPSEYCEIVYNSSFGLSYPANNQTNIDRNKKLIIHDEESNGIYKFIILRDQEFKIFTDSKEITLPHLNDLGFTLLPNTEYEWYVEKYTNFQSIDDFVSSPYNERRENGSIIQSERRKFKTSPNY